MQSEIIAGDTLNYRVSGGAHPASAGWVLRFRLVPRAAGGTVLSVSTTADGDDYLVQTSTAGWDAGVYAWSAWVELGAEQYTLEQGQITVLPDPRTAVAGTDTRTQAEIALDAAKAALAAWTPTTRRYRINGREMEFNSPGDIIAIIRHWEGEVRREQSAAAMAAGRASGRKVYVRMGRA
ncbi:MAG: hypothetical protein IPM99_18770 [Rubrivivax sp.]|nr:hypothetical protein [Rubrivivax sp.]